ncbi:MULTISPECIES: 30S ribosomal protein S3 [Fusobacterium]|uniref:Small ribosomal subunit protein uS3 n=22 Tax=Fusobacterium TaxID=848 RepID=RS3_FUSNN|nr:MULTISPECIES: 30S ribosomal protein S3 [Fusobacterium]Q8RIG1.1 RecName: Full=Small ribosomal subunit protein uS3; AltName: Full=30S ribosomal protein S3 [Fusobacterium nucleatum subsp. nucleatum ATCC 25586]EAA23486.1 SSU ribosomal protein S3P [Fusobacterium vincentii ATCC 49256]EFD81013.1 30S ribosomal protein S3 [Fusobacterium animalis D11]EGQ80526.1 30S ribosomal protein S3 [Fusobacterium animalis ATCC 51191]ETS94316.1 ribosomal protein S3 [Fusobacterium sp. CM21]MCL4577172.1 30S ribosom
MGQKVDPRGLRLGITRAWDSNWYADKKEYVKYFHEDVQIKEFIKKNYFHTGISKVRIERTSPSQVVVHIHTGKAGLIIGRKGAEIDALRAKLEKLTGKKVTVKVQEIKDLNGDAVLVAESIAAQIEKRIAYKKAMTQAISRSMKSPEVKGIKVMISGRLNGAEIARSEWAVEGKVPLHTLRADIDYAVATAHTTYGALGIKVWIFHGEVLPSKKEGGEA